MPLTLYVDGDRWRSALRSVVERQPLTVPVCKGNGYGLGLARLARKTEWLGLDTLAAGTYAEVPELASRFSGSVLVLSPWRRFDVDLGGLEDPHLADRVIHTVTRLEDLRALRADGSTPRVVLERRTSMLRHGLDARDLRAAGRLVAEGGVRFEGVALHLPLQQGSHLDEVRRLLLDVVAAGLGGCQVWVSHLDDDELATLRREWPDLTFRPRTGTGLWLGDREAMRVRSTVLDVHPVERGDVYGYRGRTAPRSGVIMVVSGGTAHGIGLEAPTGATGLRSRAATVARGALDAAGLARSPFTVDGSQRLFAEPPHMQASMLFVPAGARVPDVGEEVDVRVRFTTTRVDRTVVS